MRISDNENLVFMAFDIELLALCSKALSNLNELKLSVKKCLNTPAYFELAAMTKKKH
jgi:hypothetical protein